MFDRGYKCMNYKHGKTIFAEGLRLYRAWCHHYLVKLVPQVHFCFQNTKKLKQAIGLCGLCELTNGIIIEKNKPRVYREWRSFPERACQV